MRIRITVCYGGVPVTIRACGMTLYWFNMLAYP